MSKKNGEKYLPLHWVDVFLEQYKDMAMHSASGKSRNPTIQSCHLLAGI